MHLVLGLIFLAGLISLVVPLKFLGISSRGMAVLVIGISLGINVMYTVMVSSSQGTPSPSGSTSELSKHINPEGDTAVGLPIPANSSNWRYDEQEDRMRNQTARYASIDSDNKLDFEFPYSGGSDGKLSLRISPKFGKDVILEISKGQFLCHVDGCSVHVKFDNGPIQSFNAGEASDGSSNIIFIRNYSGFLKQLRKSKSLTIEAEYYQAGWQQLDFSPSGLNW